MTWRNEFRTCTCGGEFNPKRKGQLHCSRRCRVRSAVTRHRSDYNNAHPIAVSPALPALHGERLQPSRPHQTASGTGTNLRRRHFCWRGLALHGRRRKRPVLTLVADETYPHLFRIRYPDGWTSTPANISRAKDAAYDHARWLLSGAEMTDKRLSGK
jgi:hypothetical protein